MYAWLDATHTLLHSASSATALLADFAAAVSRLTPFGQAWQNLKAGADLAKLLYEKRTERPDWRLPETEVDGQTVGVEEEVISDKPFCNLLHFKRDCTRNDPKILLVAPLSGHYATLLRDTVRQLLPDHDVYVTDWKNAADVPVSEGTFGLDDYIDYLKDHIRQLGPDTHVVSICQSTVPVLAATALLKADEQPLSITLEAGPIDVRAAGGTVPDLVEKHDLDDLARTIRSIVPPSKEGAGREVYAGYTQLTAFMSMNPERHAKKFRDYFMAGVKGDAAEVESTREFYDEYLTVLDLDWAFYSDTWNRVFKTPELALGVMSVKGEKVDLANITRPRVLTVEGKKDDISPPGHTKAVHGLLTGVPAENQHHYLNGRAGHYGVFAGSQWQNEIAPRISWLVRDAAADVGLTYSPLPEGRLAKEAEPWDGTLPRPEPKADRSRAVAISPCGVLPAPSPAAG